MSSTAAAAVGTAVVAGIHHLHPPFTASQWQELEHQALIYKYMVAGIPVPPDLLLPIRRSIASSGFLHHPGLSYSSFYGKKIDPEPGRCRRTDGKKWRCSKDAYPESKYCERHMHRGRNRSRKPVEMPNTSLSSSSGGGAAAGMVALSSNFSNLPLNSSISISQGGHTSVLPIDHASPYGFVNKNYRYLHGTRGGDQHGFFAEGSLNAGGLGLDSAGDGSWSLMSSDMPLYPSAKDRNSSIWESNYQQIQGLQNLDAVTVCAAPSKQQQHYFFGSKFGTPKPIKQGGQPLRPFFDEWPKNRDSWTDSQDEGSNGALLATTQLSISMPVITSNFAASSSGSPNDN